MNTIARSLLCAGAVAAAFVINPLRATVHIGQTAPDFTLTDLEGKKHRLSDYKGRIVVLEWVNPGCPFVKKHYESGNMPATQKSATADGAVWLTINSGVAGAFRDSDVANVTSWAGTHGAKYTAYLGDPGGQVGRLYGAKVTPHLYVIKPDGTLGYYGAIDSIASVKPADIPRATNYVKAAIAAIKAGQPVASPITKPYGCAVKYSSRDT